MTEPEHSNAAQPDAAGSLRFLRGEVDRQLAAFQRRRRRDKRKAFALQMATVTLSAAITVLLGLRTSDATRTWLLNIALVLGAMITVMAAAEAFFTHRRLWVLRTSTVRRLETLARHLDFYSAGIDSWSDPTVLNQCLSELDAIIEDDQKGWQHVRESLAAARETPFSLGSADDSQAQNGPGSSNGSSAPAGS